MVFHAMRKTITSLFHRNADMPKELTYCISLLTYCIYHLITIFGVLYSPKEAVISNAMVNIFFFGGEALEMVRDIMSLYVELMVKSVALRKFCWVKSLALLLQSCITIYYRYSSCTT